MTMILPSIVYKDIKADPYLAPTLPAELVRNEMSEEQQKLLAALQLQRDGLEKSLAGLERDLAKISHSDLTGANTNFIWTMIFVHNQGIEATTMMIEKIKADANPNASAT